MRVELQYGGSSFNPHDLLDHIQRSGRTYIIQGQQACALGKHTKPKSLDVWLRKNYASNKDTKQADNSVIEQLVRTGLFREGRFECPDSGKIAKGIEIEVVASDGSEDPDTGLELQDDLLAELQASMASVASGGATSPAEQVAQRQGLSW